MIVDTCPVLGKLVCNGNREIGDTRMTKRTLTGRDVARLGAGRYRFDPTLWLLVQPSGSRSWIQRIVVGGIPRDKGLGGWPLVTLEAVRLTALANRRAARAGLDPFAERTRQAATAPTFADAADATRDANRAGWRASSLKAWIATMKNHVLPRLGRIRIADLNREHVIGCLKGIKSTAEARKARMRIRQACELAISRGWISDNPANGGIDAALPHLKAQDSTNHAAADHGAVGAILRRLTAAGTAAASALAFLILTAARSTEARGAEWSEVDTDAGVWTIPAARMKAGREHRVPLAPAALAILAARRGLHPRFVFGSDRGAGPVSNQGIARLVPAGATVHGFRTSFRTWAADVAHAPREIAEAALAHMNGNKTEQAYTRTDYLERRRTLMSAWAAYLAA